MKLGEPIGLRISEPIKQKLEKIANKKGCKLSPYMRMVLTQHIENEEQR
jgi:antitoxin component of RelBE/YafQ-DinJ toxin-antitoxin module|tara:strand:- start:31 stop:177 length:147 start_codon:yes stop_codon:yes gene_type:complete